MTNKQEAKLSMYSTVISFCNQYQDLIASIPALQTAHTAFTNVVSQIDNFSRNEKFAISGIAQNKKQLRENLARIAASVASNLFAFAEETGNEELKSLANFTMPDLLRYKDKELPGICRGILATANANLAGLASYNITAATLTELSDALQAYETSVPLPRTAVIDLSTSLKMLSKSFKEADSILKKRMDKIINPLKISQPKFHQSYFAGRTLPDPYTTSTQIKGTATSDETGKPLKGVIISISENGAFVKTDKDGRFVLKLKSRGPRTIKATMSGYAPVIITDTDVKLGQITKLDIVMTKKKE